MNTTDFKAKAGDDMSDLEKMGRVKLDSVEETLRKTVRSVEDKAEELVHRGKTAGQSLEHGMKQEVYTGMNKVNDEL